MVTSKLGGKYTSFWLKISTDRLDTTGSFGSLRNLLRSLPFIESSDSITEELLLQCFDGPNNQQVKTMDVASQGKMEPMPELEIPFSQLQTTCFDSTHGGCFQIQLKTAI